MYRKLLTTTINLLFLTVVTATPAFAATFSLSPSTSTPTVGDDIIITIDLDTTGEDTTGADVIIDYNTSLFELQSVSFSSLYTQQFNNSSTGHISLSGTEFTTDLNYNGSGTFAQITLRTLATGTSNLAFTCQADSSTDTNIVQRYTSQAINLHND